MTSHTTGHTTDAATAAHKPTVGEKISGTVSELVGKATHNPAKVAEGEAKKTGQPLEAGVTHGATGTHNTHGTHSNTGGLTGNDHTSGAHGVAGTHGTHGTHGAHSATTGSGLGEPVGATGTHHNHGAHGGLTGNAHHSTTDNATTGDKIADKVTPGTNTYGTTQPGVNANDYNNNPGLAGNHHSGLTGNNHSGLAGNTNTGYGNDNFGYAGSDNAGFVGNNNNHSGLTGHSNAGYAGDNTGLTGNNHSGLTTGSNHGNSGAYADPSRDAKTTDKLMDKVTPGTNTYGTTQPGVSAHGDEGVGATGTGAGYGGAGTDTGYAGGSGRI